MKKSQTKKKKKEAVDQAYAINEPSPKLSFSSLIIRPASFPAFHQLPRKWLVASSRPNVLSWHEVESLYWTHSWEDKKWIHTFQRGICVKVNATYSAGIWTRYSSLTLITIKLFSENRPSYSEELVCNIILLSIALE